MKSPPITGSSGSSTGGKKAASHPTGSGVKKASARTNKTGKAVQATGGESAQNEKKWQAFFDSALEVSTDKETVRARLFEAVAEERSKKEAEKNASKDAGECTEDDVKELMAQIYQDLHRIATAQTSKTAAQGVQTERVSLADISDTDLLVRETSVGVATVISRFLCNPVRHPDLLTHLQNPRLPTSTTPKTRHPARYGK